MTLRAAGSARVEAREQFECAVLVQWLVEVPALGRLDARGATVLALAPVSYTHLTLPTIYSV